ncbi:hypothetical protein [Nonomuraea cavernae]
MAWAVREAAMRGVTVRLVHVMPGLDSPRVRPASRSGDGCVSMPWSW